MIKCNNCGDVYEHEEDMTPIPEDDGHSYWGCVNCKTDEHLEDYYDE